jgi:drug/metabolite transporter (DMT)-like permease
MADNQTRGLLAAFAGIVILSPDTLLVRLLHLEQWPLQFYREAGAALVLFAFLFLAYGRTAPKRIRAIGLTGLLAGACFSVSSILFVKALYLTSVANTLAIISSAPIWGALLSRLALRERLPVRTWIAVFLCVLCIGLIVSGDIGGGRGSLAGDLAALVQALFMASAFVLIRSRPEVDMVPCRAVGGLLTAMVALPLAPSLSVAPADLPYLAALCLFVLPVSFGLLVTAPRHISAPEVNMIMLLEMVFGPLLVWAVTGEGASWQTLAGGSALFLVLLTHSALGLRAARARGLPRPAR